METYLDKHSNLILLCLFLLINFSHVYSKQARCYMTPDNNSGVSGLVEFTQDNIKDPVKIEVKIYGAVNIHGFHIHEFGNINGGCMSTGGHYNPTNKTHGAPEDLIRHNGDLGNLQAKKNEISFEYYDKVISLFGDKAIIGKACVIHANRDDLGRGTDQLSKVTGNSGARTACGIVELHMSLMSILIGGIVVVCGLAVLSYFLFFRKQQIYSNHDDV